MRLAPSKLALYSLTALAAALLLSIMLSNSDGASAQQAASPTPLTRPIALSAISAGAAHTCGLRDNGRVECWGRGYGPGNRRAPTNATFKSISAGGGHTCGLRPNNTAVCWGDHTYGEISITGGASATFKSIVTGINHTCGLRANGTVACWGDNRYYQSTPPDTTFTSISAGDNHTCGVRRSDSNAQCWGRNEFGESTPLSGAFTAVSAGAAHTCGLRSNGTVRCWGSNYYDPYVTRSTSQYRYTGQADPPGGAFTAISSGGAHTCYLRSNGELLCRGNSYHGIADIKTGPFTSVSAGWNHTCALRTDGRVYCWGYNGSGRSTPPDEPAIDFTPTNTPTATTEPTNTPTSTDTPTLTPTTVIDDSGAPIGTPTLTPTTTRADTPTPTLTPTTTRADIPTPTRTATRVSTPANSNANGRISRLEGQVGTLQNQVKTQQEQIKTQKGLIETQRGQLETQKGQIKTQRGFIDSLRDLIRTLTARLDALDGGSAATPTHTPTATNTPVTVLEATPTATNTPVTVLEATPTLTPTRASRSTLNPACIGKIGLGWLTGAWNADCQSTKTPPTAKEGTRYARYYAFTLDAPSRITVTISSTDVRDTYLYLLRGSGNEGEIVNRGDSEIVEQLAAGTYTIEATTYNLETAGAFTLTLDIAATGVSAAAGAPR